jgi:hypothetical protein
VGCEQSLTPYDLAICAAGRHKFALITAPYEEIFTNPATLCADETRNCFATSSAGLNLWRKGLAVHAELELGIGDSRISSLQYKGPNRGAPLTGVE